MRRIIVTLGDHADVDEFVDELIVEIQTRVEDTDCEGIPVTVEVEGVTCAICSEPITYELARGWYHPHSGDTYCGTGDGAVAYPPTHTYMHGPEATS